MKRHLLNILLLSSPLLALDGQTDSEPSQKSIERKIPKKPTSHKITPNIFLFLGVGGSLTLYTFSKQFKTLFSGKTKPVVLPGSPKINLAATPEVATQQATPTTEPTPCNPDESEPVLVLAQTAVTVLPEEPLQLQHEVLPANEVAAQSKVLANNETTISVFPDETKCAHDEVKKTEDILDDILIDELLAIKEGASTSNLQQLVKRFLSQKIPSTVLLAVAQELTADENEKDELLDAFRNLLLSRYDSPVGLEAEFIEKIKPLTPCPNETPEKSAAKRIAREELERTFLEKMLDAASRDTANDESLLREAYYDLKERTDKQTQRSEKKSTIKEYFTEPVKYLIGLFRNQRQTTAQKAAAQQNLLRTRYKTAVEFAALTEFISRNGSPGKKTSLLTG